MYSTAKLSTEVGMLKWDSIFLVSVHDDEATGPAVQSDDRVLHEKLWHMANNWWTELMKQADTGSTKITNVLISDRISF